MRRLLAATVVAAALLLAGCADSGDVRGNVDRPGHQNEIDGPAGIVTGLVVDEEARPVADAEVALVGEGFDPVASTLTDEGGVFLLDPAPVGSWTLLVQKLGYETSVRLVQVLEGETTQSDALLVAIVAKVPHHDVWSINGYFECSWSHVLGTGPCFFPAYTVDWANNNRAWNYVVGPGSQSIVNEMTWQKGTLATADSLRITFSFANRTTTHWYCDATSKNPVRMHWERGEGCLSGGNQGSPDEVPMDGQEVRTFVNTGTGPAPGFGLALQQPFTMWFSVYYWAPVPDGYTALGEG